jgi:hypothetical protein
MKWTVNDLNMIEKTPTSPAWLQTRVCDIIYNSTNCRCKVETTNPTTGEYRIVLQGTFDRDEFTPKGTY